jgi:hypothetical protein
VHTPQDTRQESLLEAIVPDMVMEATPPPAQLAPEAQMSTESLLDELGAVEIKQGN